MENKLDTRDTESSHAVFCDFCSDVQKASSHCNDCLANLCDRCVDSHNKLSSSKGRRHDVEVGVCNYDMERELCPEDGQKMSFYCRSCKVRVCPECELDRMEHAMHTVVSLTRYVGQEKEKLLDKLDGITTKTETLSHLPGDIKSMTTSIELKWLERKEHIRQEFASLLETILSQQQQLLADMEEDVQRHLAGLRQLQEQHNTVLSRACQLSDESISAVQNMPHDEFLKSYPSFEDSMKELEATMARIDSPQNYIPAFLQIPFSLHCEKLHLHKCLQLSTFNNCQLIKVKEYHRFVPFNQLTQRVRVSSLIETPKWNKLPPSTSLKYSVEMYSHSKKNKTGKQTLLWKSKVPLNAEDECLFDLSPNMLYMVKIQPIITSTSHQGKRELTGRAVSLVIVTDAAPGREVFASTARYSQVHNDLRNIQLTADSSGLLHGMHDSSWNKPHTSLLPDTVKSGNDNNNNNDRIYAPGSVSSSLKIEGRFHQPRPYICEAPSSIFNLVFPTINDAICGKGIMHCQQRYMHHCSFEEARLMEDQKLALARKLLLETERPSCLLSQNNWKTADSAEETFMIQKRGRRLQQRTMKCVDQDEA